MRACRESRLRAFAAKLRGFLSGQPPDDGFDDEIQEHLRLLADRFMAQGMSREEAALAARRQFGNTTLLQEDRRALQTLPSVEAWGHDLRYALRTLWRSPGFAIVSIVTLALGIGAAAAIYSVIHNVMLAPFPYRDANRMVFPRIYDARQGAEIGRQGYAAAEVLEFVEHSRVFEATTAALGEGGVLYRHRTGTEALNGAHVTPGTFEFFGMPALHGRVLQPSDYEPERPRSSYGSQVVDGALWRRSLDPEHDARAEWHTPDARRHHATAVRLVRRGPLLSRDVDAGHGGKPYWFLLGRLSPASRFSRQKRS